MASQGPVAMEGAVDTSQRSIKALVNKISIKNFWDLAKSAVELIDAAEDPGTVVRDLADAIVGRVQLEEMPMVTKAYSGFCNEFYKCLNSPKASEREEATKEGPRNEAKEFLACISACCSNPASFATPQVQQQDSHEVARTSGEDGIENVTSAMSGLALKPGPPSTPLHPEQKRRRNLLYFTGNLLVSGLMDFDISHTLLGDLLADPKNYNHINLAASLLRVVGSRLEKQGDSRVGEYFEIIEKVCEDKTVPFHSTAGLKEVQEFRARGYVEKPRNDVGNGDGYPYRRGMKARDMKPQPPKTKRKPVKNGQDGYYVTYVEDAQGGGMQQQQQQAYFHAQPTAYGSNHIRGSSHSFGRKGQVGGGSVHVSSSNHGSSTSSLTTSISKGEAASGTEETSVVPLFVDAQFAFARFVRQSWSMSLLYDQLWQFASMAFNSGYDLNIFCDSLENSNVWLSEGSSGGEKIEQWKRRKNGEIRQKKREFPYAWPTILGDMFWAMGVKVFYTVGNHSETIASWAQQSNHPSPIILSNDKDFCRYFPATYRFTNDYNLSIKNNSLVVNNLQLVPPPGSPSTKTSNKPTGPIPSTPLLVRFPSDFLNSFITVFETRVYARAPPTPYVVELGNPHLLLRPLRQIVYFHLFQSFEIQIFECLPYWDPQIGQMVWTDEFIYPELHEWLLTYDPMLWVSVDELVWQAHRILEILLGTGGLPWLDACLGQLAGALGDEEWKHKHALFACTVELLCVLYRGHPGVSVFECMKRYDHLLEQQQPVVQQQSLALPTPSPPGSGKKKNKGKKKKKGEEGRQVDSTNIGK